MPIEIELLRSCILEALRRTPGTQYVNLDIETARVARERGLPIRQGTEPHLELHDMRRFRETLWALVVEGVVVIGKDAYNDQWPWLSLTEYGEEVVSSGGAIRMTLTDSSQPWLLRGHWTMSSGGMFLRR
jgi:hypothetical protein